MQKEVSAHLVFIHIDMMLHSCASLKAKRSIVKKIKEKIRNRFNASVAEIGYQEKWQRCGIGISMLGSDKVKLQQDVHKLEELLRTFTDVEPVDFRVEWI